MALRRVCVELEDDRFLLHPVQAWRIAVGDACVIEPDNITSSIKVEVTLQAVFVLATVLDSTIRKIGLHVSWVDVDQAQIDSISEAFKIGHESIISRRNTEGPTSLREIFANVMVMMNPQSR